MDTKKTIRCDGKDTFRLSFGEKKISVSFVKYFSGKEVTSTMSFPPELLPPLIYSLVGATVTYQKEYRDLGFNLKVEGESDNPQD